MKASGAGVALGHGLKLLTKNGPSIGNRWLPGIGEAALLPSPPLDCASPLVLMLSRPTVTPSSGSWVGWFGLLTAGPVKPLSSQRSVLRQSPGLFFVAAPEVFLF